MQIPPFPRPSNLTDIVHFRVPNVSDALSFCNLSEEQEEMHTTQYLNQIQDKEKQGGAVKDSALWTGEDRRTALWWIFIATHRLPEVTVSYFCQHCQEDHYVNIHLPDLAETATAVKAIPEHSFDAVIAGEVVKGIKVRPLNGAACENVESMRSQMLAYEKGSKEYTLAQHKLHITEIANAVVFPDEPSDLQEAVDYKVSQLLSMALDTEFRSLVANVEMGLRKQRHGLMMRYEDGRYMLVAEHKNCEKAVESGEGKSKLLLIPFRPNDFIATL